jgi:manganese oxidase
MRVASLLLAGLVCLQGSTTALRRALPLAAPNDNRKPAGHLAGGVLRIDLDAALAMWHPDGDSLPGIPVEVFAERGQRPQVPGPLVRMPAGTQILLSIRNTLEHDTLTFVLPNDTGADSIAIVPGATREMRVRAPAPGTYLYRATTSTALGRLLGVGGLLAGAMVADSTPGAPPRDRIFVLSGATDGADPIFGGSLLGRTVRAINGRSWPHTERIRARVGDTLRWRVINVGRDIHPMHLHGFYYRVDAFSSPSVATERQGDPGRMVVTERMSAFSTMSMSWVPERAGNWLFHCHFQEHVTPHGPLGGVGPDGTPMRIGKAPASEHGDLHANHALTQMAGLVVGIEVQARSGPSPRLAADPRSRKLRLVAIEEPGLPDSIARMRFILEDPAAPSRAAARSGDSPVINLVKGESVEITVVNRLRDALAVHWHGIELESYFDGVAGFSGSAQRLAPTIAPADSFVARFTPPRAGTFIYHSHVSEPRHHRAGLAGALIVRDREPRAPAEEIVYVMRTAHDFVLDEGFRIGASVVPIVINGSANPDTTVLRVGKRYKMRIVGMATGFPNATFILTARADSSLANLADSLVLQWSPVAKDGFDLPQQARAPRLARQIVSIGETYDYEITPERVGNLRLEVRQAGPRGRLLARVPLRVE